MNTSFHKSAVSLQNLTPTIRYAEHNLSFSGINLTDVHVLAK